MDSDIRWLSLIDQLYQLLELEPETSLQGLLRLGSIERWPTQWRALIGQLEAHADVRIEILPVAQAASALMSMDLNDGARCEFAAFPVSGETLSSEQNCCVRSFLQHLEQGLAIAAHLAGQREDIDRMYECLEQAGLAIAMLDESGQVQFLNQRCRFLLDNHDSLQMCQQRICVVARGGDVLSGTLDTLGNQLHDQELNVVLDELEIRVRKLGSSFNELPELSNSWLEDAESVQNGSKRFHFLLTLIENQTTLQTEALFKPEPVLQGYLSRQYRLSDMECLLAINICHGLSLKQVAFLTGRSVETVRVQLKSLYRKLGLEDRSSLCLFMFRHLQAHQLSPMLNALHPEVLAGLPALA